MSYFCPFPFLLLNLVMLDLPSHLLLQVFILEFFRKKVNLMACFVVVVLKSQNQTVMAAEAKLQHSLQRWLWAGSAESFFKRLLLQADITFSLNSVAVSSTVPLNYGNIYDFLSTLKLKLVLPFFESISKIMEYITEQLSISELCTMLICSSNIRDVHTPTQILVGWNRLSYHKTGFYKVKI